MPKLRTRVEYYSDIAVQSSSGDL